MALSEIHFDAILQLLEKAGSLISKLDKSLCEEPKISGRFGEIMDSFLVELINLFTSLCLVLNKRQAMTYDNQSTLRSIVKCVPYLITVTWKLLNASNLCKICSSIRENAQFHFNKLSARRTKLIQAATEFVVYFYESSFASIDFKFKFVQDNVDKSEFIVRLDDRIKLEDEFDKFVSGRICTDFQRMAMKRALETAYEMKRNSIRETLAKQRMFEFIGHPKERVIAEQLQELAELMTDLSKQQLHLCLRHFGYDFEQTLANLCERDKLPLDLKIILRITDSFDDVSFFEKKMLPIADDGSAFADEANDVTPSALFENVTKNGDFNLEKLRKIMRLLESADDELEVDGKVLIRQQFREKEKGQTEEEASKLRELNLRLVRQMEERDDEQQESDEEAAAANDAQKDEKLGEEVGQSGRFNRSILSAAMDPYEDEYDDTFEHALLYSQVDGGATTADEKETVEMKMARKHFKEAAQNTGKNANRGEKPTARHEANSSANAKELVKKQSTSTYTGGRERQLKERNKGKERQKGADKKAKKTQFF